MRKLILISGALVLIALAGTALAVGTLVVTQAPVGSQVQRYDSAWTSSAGGAVSGNSIAVRGYIFQAQFVPGSAGTQPTDLYDATLTAASVDLLDGAGANLSNATPTLIQFHPPIYFDGTVTLDLVIANAGNAKTGTFTLWVRP